MFDDWSTLWTILAVIAGIFVVYWVLAGALIGYAQRDLKRRGAPDWLGWAFVLSTPVGLIVWLVVRKFFPVKDDKGSTAITTTAKRGLRG